MTKQEFLSELAQALSGLPHAEAQQALAFYEEAINDRMEDGLSEEEAVADLGPVEEIAAHIAIETPPMRRAMARANTGSRPLNIALLVLFSPIWIPVTFALSMAALAIYLSIWVVIASLWIVDAVLVLMPLAGFSAFISLAGSDDPASGRFALGLTLTVGGIGLPAFFGVFWTSKLLFHVTRSFARRVARLFVRVRDEQGANGNATDHPPILEEGDSHA